MFVKTMIIAKGEEVIRTLTFQKGLNLIIDQTPEDDIKTTYFILAGISSVATKAAAGFVTSNVWIGFAAGTAGLLLGAVLGKLTRAKIKPAVLKKTVYGVMAVSGVLNVVLALV